MLTGILLTNKTYGRDKKGRVLYRCIADLNHIADILIPFNNPSLQSFNKAPVNYYIVFSLLDTAANTAFRQGKLIDCLGKVDDWTAYSKYELFKRNLYRSGFQNLDKQIKLLSPIQGVPNTHHIISIDPSGCTDIDDAFAFYINDNKAFLQIHIANVPIFMETYNLWNLLSDRATTVYMPTGKVPMLPKHISDNACSLLQGTVRPTFMIEFEFEYNVDTHTIIRLLGHKAPVASFAYINKNYSYDDKDIPNINLLIEAAKFLEPSQNISDTHDLIAVFMIAFNKICAPYVPIYRNCVECAFNTGAAFFNELQSVAAYSLQCEGHISIGTAYTHITSPIRRMADLVNMTAMLYGTTHPFVQNWIKQIEHMNYYCKQARKAQQNAELYKLLSAASTDELIYDGIYVKNINMVYLLDLRLFVYVSANQNMSEDKGKYKVYMFHKEFTLKRKIRIMLVEL